jgi:hypothetical protein
MHQPLRELIIKNGDTAQVRPCFLSSACTRSTTPKRILERPERAMAALHLAPKIGAVTVARERRAVIEALVALASEKWRAARPEFGRIPSFVRLDRNMVVRLRIFLAVWVSVGQPVSVRGNFIKDYSGRNNTALAKFLAEKTSFLCIPQKRA